MPNKFRIGKMFQRKVKQGPIAEKNGLRFEDFHNMSCVEWWATHKHFFPEVAHMTFQQVVDSGWLISYIKKATEDLKKMNGQ